LVLIVPEESYSRNASRALSKISTFFIVFGDLRGEAVVRFVDIGGIREHHF
jgi:hypothetical protein